MVRIEVEITDIRVGGSSPSLGEVMLEAAAVLHAEWQSAARQHADTGNYAESIRIVGVREEENSFIAELEAQSPYALVLEDGRQSFNMAERVDWGTGKGVRVTREGKRVIIVPFQHFSPSSEEDTAKFGLSPSRRRAMMPDNVYALAQKLERSHFTGGERTYVHYVAPHAGRTPHTTVNPATGAETVVHREGREYQWGPRVITVKDGLVTSSLERLYKFGDNRHTSYISFRTMTPSSNWQIPAFAGHKMAEQAAREAQDKIADMVSEVAIVNLVKQVFPQG